MAKKKFPRFFEPWVARQSTKVPPHPFPNGPPEGFEGEALDRLLMMHAKSVDEADWLIWGSGMMPETVCKALQTGQDVTMDDERIVATFRRYVTPEGSQGPSALCQRAAECVNAMTGVAKPQETMKELRELLLLITKGWEPTHETQVLKLLDRLGKGE